MSSLAPTVFTETEYLALERAFLHYQGIRELREYVIVSHRERRIDCFRRVADGQWHLTPYTREEDDVALPSLGGSFRLADAYAKVALDEGGR